MAWLLCGMRLTVSLIVNPVGKSMSTKEIRRKYPLLEVEDIRQTLQYVASLANAEIHLLGWKSSVDVWQIRFRHEHAPNAPHT